MACTPPEARPATDPHWKVNCRPLGELFPEKVMEGDTATMVPDLACTTTDDGRRPEATICVLAIPSPRLLVAEVGLNVMPPELLFIGKLNSTCAPAMGWPVLSMARKRTVVTSPMRGCAGSVSTNSSDAGCTPPHPRDANRRPQVAAIA